MVSGVRPGWTSRRVTKVSSRTTRPRIRRSERGIGDRGRRSPCPPGRHRNERPRSPCRNLLTRGDGRRIRLVCLAMVVVSGEGGGRQHGKRDERDGRSRSRMSLGGFPDAGQASACGWDCPPRPERNSSRGGRPSTPSLGSLVKAVRVTRDRLSPLRHGRRADGQVVATARMCCLTRARHHSMAGTGRCRLLDGRGPARSVREIAVARSFGAVDAFPPAGIDVKKRDPVPDLLAWSAVR